MVTWCTARPRAAARSMRPDSRITDLTAFSSSFTEHGLSTIQPYASLGWPVAKWVKPDSSTTGRCPRSIRTRFANSTPPSAGMCGSVNSNGESPVCTVLAGLVGSMSRAGNRYDHAHIESVVKTLKHEEVFLTGERTWAELSAVLPTYLDTVFNGARLHSALGYLPPVAYEQQHHLTRAALWADSR